MVVRAIRLFEPFGLLEQAVVVAPPEHTDAVAAAVTDRFGSGAKIRVVAGGSHRQESVRLGLENLSADTDIVAIHDAARPFTSREVIAECIAAARAHGAAVAAVPPVDTIVDTDADGAVAATLDRGRLRAVQTPQVFDYRLIRDAHEQAKRDGFIGTDDVGLVIRAGGRVQIVTSTYDNIKITVARDLEVAARIMGDTCCA